MKYDIRIAIMALAIGLPMFGSTITNVSDGSTLAAATAVNAVALTTGNTAGLTFGPDTVGALGTGTPIPPGAPATAEVINIDTAYNTTGTGDSGFFEVTFTLPASFTAASISGAANADDQGFVFLNGTSLASITEYGNTTFSSNNQALFLPGTNTFLVSDINAGGGPSGAAFYATITYTAGSAVPEPSTLFLSALGIVPFFFLGRRGVYRRRARQ